MTTPLATLQDVKTYAAITSANLDTVINQLLPTSLVAIGAYCNRIFQSQQMTEYRDGNDASRMLLVNYPITSFQSLTIDGITIPASVNLGPGYFFAGRALVLRGYKFTRGLRNVVIQYTGGYGDASGVNGADLAPWPSDLKMAYMMYVVTRMKERERLGVGSMSLAGQSVTFDATSGTSGGSQGIPSAAKLILDNYANTVPESGE